MALISAKFPMIYKRKVTEGTLKFEPPVAVGRAIQLVDTPTVARVSLYADDVEAENSGGVSSRTLALGTSTVPTSCAKDMFGITVDTVSGSDGPSETVTYSEDADGDYLGFSIIRGEVVDGVKKFVLNFYPKVKFDQPAETYTTKGEALSFGTHTINGKAVSDSLMLDNEGRAVNKKEFVFSTAAAAITYQKTLGTLVDGGDE